jgi:endoglucanase
MKKIILLTLALVSLGMQAQEAPFHRGVNLTGWFQASGPRQVQYTKYTRTDFENIKSLGFDVIRLPINLHFMTDGEPDYTLDPIFLNYLEQVVTWAEELEIYLILDNHTFSVSEATDPGVGNILNKVWSQMATAFRDRSGYLCYEVLNEPHDISDALWNQIQQSVVETIRQTDTIHYIVIGPAGWNSYSNLAAMPVYEDDKLIYTFHFYDPFLFTHQGASWVDPSMEGVENVPFPYNSETMPSMPGQYAGTWVGSLFSSYTQDGTVKKIRELIDIAVRFREQRGAALYCGEFGVYQPNSPEVDRVEWYKEVSTYLDSMNIAWTTWDYHGGFGLFEKNSNGLFEHDLNVPLLEAIGANIPPQTEYEQKPDTTGLIIYDDYLSSAVREASYGDGTLDYYDTGFPNSGEYCIHWAGASQYNAIAIDLMPDRDFSVLTDEGFALDFMIRGDDPSTSFDMRFLDSKTSDPLDLPWRMGITVNDQLVEFDSMWHHLHVPLQDFTEKGSWYIDTWYDPRNEFDWSDVDRLEIVAEQQAMGEADLWFDQILITDLDTTQTRPGMPDTTITAIRGRDSPLNSFSVYPNPSDGHFKIYSSDQTRINYEIFDLRGALVLKGSTSPPAEVCLCSHPNGIYFLSVNDLSGYRNVTKIILQSN